MQNLLFEEANTIDLFWLPYTNKKSYLIRLEHYKFITHKMLKTAHSYSPPKHKYHAPLS